MMEFDTEELILVKFGLVWFSEVWFGLVEPVICSWEEAALYFII